MRAAASPSGGPQKRACPAGCLYFDRIGFFVLFGYFRTFTSIFSAFRILNTIDFIVCLVLGLAVWKGWRQGFIVQIGSLVALVVGLWLAARYGAVVGERLQLDESVRTAGGFVVVLLGVMLSIAVAGRLLRRIFRFAGFGLLDIALGVAACAVKYLLLVSVLLTAFDRLNSSYSLVGQRTIDSSVSYRPLLRISEALFPMLERATEQATHLSDDKLQNA